jgi:glutamate--cysteine ligase
VESGKTPANTLLDLYNSRWNQQVDPVFDELMY